MQSEGITNNSNTDSVPKDDNVPKDDIIITAYLLAKDDGYFYGHDLLQNFALKNVVYDNISKIFQLKNTHSQSFIGIANSHEPGTFDIENIAALECRGIAIFLDLNVLTNSFLDSYNVFIELIEYLQCEMQGVLITSNGKPVTTEVKNFWREQVQRLCLRYGTKDLFSNYKAGSVL